jgi:hypothetical protein
MKVEIRLKPQSRAKAIELVLIPETDVEKEILVYITLLEYSHSMALPNEAMKMVFFDRIRTNLNDVSL